MTLPRLRQKLGDVPWLALLVYAGVLFGALYLFAVLAGEVYEKERFAFDAPILTWLDAVSNPALTVLAQSFSFVGSVYVLGPVALLLLFLFWRNSRRAAVFFGLGFGGALALNLTAKAFFARARPDLFEALSHATNYSFPSGHTMGSTAFFLALYLATREVFPGQRVWAGLAGLVLALGISLSRPYLQVHYPSDILAGWGLSTAWVLGVNAWYSRVYRRKVGVHADESARS